MIVLETLPDLMSAHGQLLTLADLRYWLLGGFRLQERHLEKWACSAACSIPLARSCFGPSDHVGHVGLTATSQEAVGCQNYPSDVDKGGRVLYKISHHCNRWLSKIQEASCHHVDLSKK